MGTDYFSFRFAGEKEHQSYKFLVFQPVWQLFSADLRHPAPRYRVHRWPVHGLHHLYTQPLSDPPRAQTAPERRIEGQQGSGHGQSGGPASQDVHGEVLAQVDARVADGQGERPDGFFAEGREKDKGCGCGVGRMGRREGRALLFVRREILRQGGPCSGLLEPRFADALIGAHAAHAFLDQGAGQVGSPDAQSQPQNHGHGRAAQFETDGGQDDGQGPEHGMA